MSNEKADTLRRICLEYIAGSSMGRIAKVLNADCVSCFGGGKQWTQGMVKPQLYSTLTQTILTPEQYAHLHSALITNRVRKGGVRQDDWIANLFPNRVWCKCGASISTHSTKSKTNKSQRYYRCSARCKTIYQTDSFSCRIDLIEGDLFQSFLPSLTQTKEVIAIRSVIGENIEQALKSPDVRAKLVLLLPSVVIAIKIDLGPFSKYSVTTVGGKQWPMRNGEAPRHIQTKEESEEAKRYQKSMNELPMSNKEWNLGYERLLRELES